MLWNLELDESLNLLLHELVAISSGHFATRPKLTRDSDRIFNKILIGRKTLQSGRVVLLSVFWSWFPSRFTKITYCVKMLYGLDLPTFNFIPRVFISHLPSHLFRCINTNIQKKIGICRGITWAYTLVQVRLNLKLQLPHVKYYSFLAQYAARRRLYMAWIFTCGCTVMLLLFIAQSCS